MRSHTPSYHDRFTQLMFRDQYEVQKFCCISDDVAMVQCRHADGRGSWVKDVFVGAMTTPYARLGLYDLIDKPHECVFVLGSKQCHFHLSTRWVGPCLGSLPQRADWRDEWTVAMEREGRITSQSVSGVPKCYAYHTRQTKLSDPLVIVQGNFNVIRNVITHRKSTHVIFFPLRT